VSFDFPHNISAEYTKRLNRRVEAAQKTIQRAFDELRRAERADPATWQRLLAKAYRAYNETFDPFENRELADSIIRSVEDQRRAALGVERLQLDLETRAMLQRDQLDAMKVLVDDYYARLQRPETDDNGLIGIVALAGAIEATTGIIRRRGEFYARNETGNIYHRTTAQFDAELGVNEWVWLRTTAANPRDFHLRRVGTIFTRDTYPDMPGDLYNCQCGMKPTRDALRI
jgi:hypothetical protein